MAWLRLFAGGIGEGKPVGGVHPPQGTASVVPIDGVHSCVASILREGNSLVPDLH